MEKNQITVEELRNQDSERYFQELLELSEFEELKKLVEDSDRKISWEKLAKKGVVKIENQKLEGIYWKWNLNLRGTRIESLGKLKKVKGNLYCYNLESLKDLGELEEVGGDLGLRKTKIKSLGKLKKIEGNLYCKNLASLKDLGELEKVGGYCDLRGTIIKSLGKLKKVERYLDCENLASLKDLGELEEVLRFCDLRGTRIESLGKLKKLKLDLDCENLESLEGLGELEEVGGQCNLSGTSINLQIEIIKKEKKGKIKIGSLIVDEILEEVYKEEELDLEKFREFYGEDINKIEDKEIKERAIEILRYEYAKKLKRIEIKIKKIIEENKGRKLTDDEKEQIKREIKELDVEFREMKERIEGFGISL